MKNAFFFTVGLLSKYRCNDFLVGTVTNDPEYYCEYYKVIMYSRSWNVFCGSFRFRLVFDFPKYVGPCLKICYFLCPTD